MRIRVDTSICTGHAMCAAKGGDMFTLDQDGFSSADGNIVPLGSEELARRGKRACPERAISLIDGFDETSEDIE